MSLYEKYRPQTLNDIVGNASIVDGLGKIFKKKDHIHTFLFYGPSGCGKTTFGHVISKIVGSKPPDLVHINGGHGSRLRTQII